MGRYSRGYESAKVPASGQLRLPQPPRWCDAWVAQRVDANEPAGVQDSQGLYQQVQYSHVWATEYYTDMPVILVGAHRPEEQKGYQLAVCGGYVGVNSAKD